MVMETSREQSILRSPLGRARGLGAAKSGVHHWWSVRLSSIALVPLTAWFVWSVIALAGLPHGAVLAWMAAPLNTVLLLLLVGISFHHAAQGLQVLIEDYVHVEFTRLLALLAMKAVVWVLALVAVVAVLRVAL
jgi:succinate dehydrogenase / fumarate reductase membrane anchor subunit